MPKGVLRRCQSAPVIGFGKKKPPAIEHGRE